MELKIYDKQGIVKMTVSPDNSSQWNHEVGVENVVTVNFTTWEFLVLEVGWYILVENQKFSIKSEYRPKHIHNTKYTYNLKFYGREHDTQDILYCRLNQGEYDLESVFAYDGTPMDFLQKVVANMNRNTEGVVWKAGEAISVNRKTINFNGLYCWDALNEISRTFGTEWWMDGEYLNISKCERGESVSLGYGQGLKSGLTQNENTNAVKWFTRLIPVGSSKNIDKSKYGYATLQLPGREKYIDINTQYGLKEYREEAAFSEIYPHRVGAISSVRSEERTNEETGNYTVYYVKDSSLPFNPDEYMIGGEVIHMTFNSGALAGKDFEVNWNNETKEFEIINQYPDENTQLPGGNLVPSADDTYVLWNISMPDEYIRAAEQEYKEAVDAYLAEYSKDISIYSGNTDYIYIDQNNVPLLLGQRVRLLSGIYFGNIGRDSRITRVSRKLNNLNEATIDCSDAIASSWKSSVDSSLNQLQFAVSNEMAQALIQILKTGEPGTPSDYNVLSALRSLNTFLRKDKDDTAKGNIAFEKNIGSPDFVKGNLMGAGWSIYKDANGNTVVETDTIIARKGINASELIINQETFQKGSTIYVKGGCTITKVEEIDGVYRCYYDNEGGKRFSGFVVGDQARCQRYDSSYGLKIKYYWRLVVGVADDYVDLSMTDFDGDGVPEAGDDIAQLGNRTDKNRQSAIVISPDNGGSVVVWAGIGDGEYPYSLSEKNMCGMGVNPNTGHAYLYGYGDMYFGDRNESSFVKFDVDKGVEVKAKRIIMGSGEALEETIGRLADNVSNVATQLDGSIEIWQGDYTSTDEKLIASRVPPSSDWDTDAKMNEHLGDYLVLENGMCYELEYDMENYRYIWKSVTDKYLVAYLRTLDTKKAIFKITDESLPMAFFGQKAYNIGDLWVNAVYPESGETYNDETLVCITPKAAGEQFDITHWTPADGTKKKLLEAGIDINTREIAFTAEQFKFKNLLGELFAVLEEVDGVPTIRAELLNITGQLIAEKIMTSGLDIGGKFVVTINEDGTASVKLSGVMESASSGKRIVINPDSQRLEMYASDGKITGLMYFIEDDNWEHGAIELYRYNGDNLFCTTLCGPGYLKIKNHLTQEETEMFPEYIQITSRELESIKVGFRYTYDGLNYSRSIVDIHSSAWPLYNSVATGGVYLDGDTLKVKT